MSPATKLELKSGGAALRSRPDILSTAETIESPNPSARSGCDPIHPYLNTPAVDANSKIGTLADKTRSVNDSTPLNITLLTLSTSSVVSLANTGPVRFPVMLPDVPSMITDESSANTEPVISPTRLPETFPVTFPVISPIMFPITLPAKFPVTLPAKFPVTLPTTLAYNTLSIASSKILESSANTDPFNASATIGPSNADKLTVAFKVLVLLL